MDVIPMIQRCAEGQRFKGRGWDGTNWVAVNLATNPRGMSWDLCPEIYLDTGSRAAIRKHPVFEIKEDGEPQK